MFDPRVLMPVFEAHGMATRAKRLELGDTTGFIIGFVRPEADILGGEVLSADIRIEYATADAPDLAPGTWLEIDGVDHRVRGNPQAQGDGTFTRAELERMR